MNDTDQLSQSLFYQDETNIDPAEIESLRDHLIAYNISEAHINEGIDLAILVRDSQERLVGGVSGRLWGRCLEIELLWVNQGYRGQGIGTNLLAKIENSAIRLGAQTALLDTFSFQAPSLYERAGYVRFGTIDGFGHKHQKIFYRKQLGSVTTKEGANRG
jgi:GNAT superfamily N-acetyltransferase